MAGFKKPAMLLITSLFIFTTGCDFFGMFKKDNADEPLITDDLQKQKLLKRLDKKYDDAEAHYQLGKLYLADGLWTKAEMEFNLAVNFDPSLWKAEAAKVKAIMQSGNSQRAKLSAENAMNRASVSAEASLLLGRAFQKELMDDYALACYQQALRLAPNSAALNKQIGYYYLAKGDKVRAEEYLKRSFQLNPYQPEVAGELGRLGIIVQIPRKQQKNTSTLDKLLNRKDK